MMKFIAENKVYGQDFEVVGKTKVETIVKGEDIYAVMECFNEFLVNAGWNEEVIYRGFCRMAGVEEPENSVIKALQDKFGAIE